MHLDYRGLSMRASSGRLAATASADCSIKVSGIRKR